MSLDLDFEILNADWERLVALESIGVPADYPAVVAIHRRWGLTPDAFPTGESRAMMERAQVVADGHAQGGIIANAVGGAAKAVAKGAGRAAIAGAKGVAAPVGRGSKQLLLRFHDFAKALGEEQVTRMKDAVSKATIMETRVRKLEESLAGKGGTLKPHSVDTGRWTPKVCIEDKVNVKGCIAFVQHADATEAVVQKYTVKTRSLLKSAKILENGELEHLGRSTNWAVKRSAGLLGIVNPAKHVTATPFAGNVIVVEHFSGAVQFAVAGDGDYGDTLPSLSKDECKAALGAAKDVVAALRARGVKRKAVGYTGIYDEVERMERELKGLDGRALRDATQRFKNALALEDAFTTALTRTGDGLLEYVHLTLKGKS